MRIFALGRKVIDGWALMGGLVLAVIVLVNVWTTVGSLIGLPFAGDVELTEMMVAAAAFMFLPFCQLHRHNVTADIFTSNMNPRFVSLLNGIASLVALGFAALLLWRMTYGMLDTKEYNYSSTILSVPLWWPYVPILVSLALLFIAAVITTAEDLFGAS
ncbi:TRAP transporter small permease [Marivivens donghaensis]|uniref:TRAP transporter small permease protein n=1 Tax=Marivivens donghaensis TaxID=1699413 RepID=A0ABX0W447_9RHOB|nr:TRAP transporter small permease [Marivivens donghaensis]NIY73707.1 TRAP transporter small permease [Marivivens donghaensis]